MHLRLWKLQIMAEIYLTTSDNNMVQQNEILVESVKVKVKPLISRLQKPQNGHSNNVLDQDVKQLHCFHKDL